MGGSWQSRSVVQTRGLPPGLTLCIIDAIQSTGSHYNSVRKVVGRYREYRGGDAAITDGTTELLATFDALGGVEPWAREIGNQRPASTRKGGAALKAAVIQQVARNLHDDGVRTTGDLQVRGALEPNNEALRLATKKLWTGGRGPVLRRHLALRAHACRPAGRQS